MILIRLLPAILSLIILGAHFLRGGQLVLLAAVAGLLPLMALRRWWIARLLQLVLIVGAAEWVRTTVALVEMRQAFGAPYVRMVVILAAVAAVTAASALVFETRTVRAFYTQSSDEGE